jgi:hypothetical protein
VGLLGSSHEDRCLIYGLLSRVAAVSRAVLHYQLCNRC